MKKYIAVIFCHGIGSPRHYLTTANFIDALDVQGSTENPKELGFIRNLSSEVEMLDDGEVSSRNYIKFSRIQNVKTRDRSTGDYRVYEAYWADDHHQNSSILYALCWLTKVIWFSVLAPASRWRSYPALRRRILNQMVVNERQRKKINKYYESFDNADGRRRFPKGRFKDFRQYIATLDNERETEALDKLAITWRSEFARMARERFFRVLVIALPVFAITSFVYAMSFYLVTLLFGNTLTSLNIHPSAPKFLAAFAVMVLLFFGWRHIRRLVSDIIAWTTVHESQENFLVRERRVKLAQKLVRDVLGDPNCIRCVLVGHSLGSSIVLEAFQRENTLCRATNICARHRELAIGSIKKVSHIFTVGSPIEKIASLFHADSGEHHRYHRVKHSNPNRLDEPAWDASGGPRLINFWSRFDLISSSISSLQALKNVSWNGVENIEVSPIGAPLPFSAHSGYFKDAGTISVIYQAIISGNISEKRLSRAKFSSKITRITKTLLLSLYAVLILGVCVWLFNGIDSGWLKLCLFLLLFLSLAATFVVVRKDYTRHRCENAG